MRFASGGSCTCSRPEVDSVAQTGKARAGLHDGEPGFDALADAERRARRMNGASRTAPPAILPSIMRGLAHGGLVDRVRPPAQLQIGAVHAR